MRTNRTGSAHSRCSGRRRGAHRARCRVPTTGCEIDAELEPARPNAVSANKSVANSRAANRDLTREQYGISTPTGAPWTSCQPSIIETWSRAGNYHSFVLPASFALDGVDRWALHSVILPIH